ncbi:alpha-tocopherol transfer protein-like [Choristoneura fumiferana]|uniref:alpha-tocopherol transfer protein-like n=1 Tax=Choristoneura fumiferana TaxID=7141 RepID=UPI003D156B9D
MSGVVKQFPVEKEYEKNPDISPEDILKLREWLKTQPHLPGDYLDELDLIISYHCCERSAEVSKQVIDLHYTLRTLFPFFKDRCYDMKIEFTMNTVLIAPLPTPTVHGYRAIYARLLDADPRHFNFVDAVRTFMMIFDLWQYEEGTWPGFVLIIDMDTAVVAHLARVELMALRQVLYFLQEVMLVKLKGVHFLNAPGFMDKLLLMLRPFLKKDLLDMLYIHQRDSSSTYDHIPKKAFPKNCGGEYKDFETIKEELIVRLQSNPTFFRDENRRRVNETLRKGKKATVEDLFGIQGSFKKLDID